MRIAPFTSFFLDGLRLFAALGVVLVHLSNSGLAPTAKAFLPYGEYFVVAFFVLSGFVIAASTDPRRHDAVHYFSLRLARLWTVALPCLLVAFMVEKIGGLYAPEYFQEFERGHSWFRYALAATFTNELWFISGGPPMILPVWSLAYEFWYYVLFGVSIFVKRLWLRAITILSISAFIGPKILALFPIWLLGVVLWQTRHWRLQWVRWAPAVIMASLVLVLGMLIAQPHWPGKIGSAPWFFSASWLSNLLFGVGVAGLIFGIDARFYEHKEPSFANKLIRRGAGVSFSIYLLHFPLMVFCGAFLPYHRSSIFQVAAVLCLILFTIYLFGSIFEPMRKRWSNRLEAWTRYLFGINHSGITSSVWTHEAETLIGGKRTGEIVDR